MLERTSFRLAMLRNGFQPLLNNCKRPIETGWPKKIVTEAEVLSWDRSALASTGMKIDGDLAVIDADVADASLVAALADALDERFPELFARGLVRHAGGPKEAWIARVDEPFGQFRSRRWYRGSDPDDPTAPKYMVECFGSLGTRQFGIDGPHTRDRGVVISTYSFAGGASPATTLRASLPVLPKSAYAAACDLFDRIAEAAGLRAVTRAGQGGGRGAVYDLTDAMLFESEHGTYRLDELEEALRAAQHEGRELRLTSSFLGHGANPTKCIVGYSRRSNCVCIHDFETGLTHMPADRKPVEDRLWERLLALIPDRRKKGDSPCPPRT
jgi:hypothetical protein